MSCDKLVYDLATEVEGSPNIFLKKDWLNILDTQNGNYSANQSVIETSSLANSNKWLSYREARLEVPLVISMSSVNDSADFEPAAAASSANLAVGLKNSYTSLIHSILLDYNGVTVIQQQNFLNMWNGFKLMTTFSWADVSTMGASIGFYPDSYETWLYNDAATGPSGTGVCNNVVCEVPTTVGLAGFSNANAGHTNVGLAQRLKWIAFDVTANANGAVKIGGANVDYTDLISQQTISTLYKSSVFNKQNGAAALKGCVQTSVMATIYLKHLHSFFQQVPLLKGAYLRLTLLLNNTSVTYNTTVALAGAPSTMALTGVTNSVGGICPLLLASAGVQVTQTADIAALETAVPAYAPSAAAFTYPTTAMTANVSVGSRCLDTQMTSGHSQLAVTSNQNVLLYIPAYSFNPVFESAYLSSPIKHVKYTDVYQYSIKDIAAGGQINQLITNGIAGIRSILILPFFTAAASNAGGRSPYQSPFDPAGAGGCSPLAFLNNMNVVVSGSNAIYNTQRYNFEEWSNQLYGVNAVNGGMTDGLTSGLVDYLGWQSGQCGYYVDISRMLPVEESVPKSIQLIGQNVSAKACDYIVFVEYAVSISIDTLSGSRV